MHGRSRSWRDRRRIWPSVVAALAALALVIAATAVVESFQRAGQNVPTDQPIAVSTSPTHV